MAIATTAAIGLGLAAAGTTGSFIQASKQRKKSAEAEAAAEEAMALARKRLEANYMKGLSINREPYELARDASLSSGTTLVQAGVESERGAGAVAGRVQMAQNQNQNEIRSAMGTELNNLNKVVASEESRLRDMNYNLDLGIVEGAQRASANYENMANNSMTQGFQGVTSIGGQVLAAAPLYPKTDLPVTPQTATPQSMASAPDAAAEFVANPLSSETEYFAQASAGTLDPKYIINGQPMPYSQALKLNQPITSASPDYYKTLFPQTFAAIPQ